MKFLKLFSAILILSISLIIACKKENKTPARASLSVESLEISTSQVVVINADRGFIGKEFKAKLGDNEIKVYKLYDLNTLAFLVPQIPSGTYIFSLLDEQFSGSFNFVVEEVIVNNPEQVINDFKTSNQSIFSKIDSVKNASPNKISQAQIDDILLLEQNFEKYLNELNPDEKEILASFIVANQLAIGHWNPLTVNPDYNRTTYLNSPEDEWVRIRHQIVRRGASIMFYGSAFSLLAGAPEVALTKPLALAAAVKLCYDIVCFLTDLEEAVDVKGVIESVKDWFNRNELHFQPNESKEISTEINYRKLLSSDNNHPSTFINSTVLTINQVNELWLGFKNKMSSLSSWITGGTLKLETNDVKLATSKEITPFLSNANYFYISNVSNGVELTSEVSDNQLFLKATSDKSTPFTFRINFKHPEIDHVVSKNIDGYCEGFPSIAQVNLSWDYAWNNPENACSNHQQVARAFVDIVFSDLVPVEGYLMQKTSWRTLPNGSNPGGNPAQQIDINSLQKISPNTIRYFGVYCWGSVSTELSDEYWYKDLNNNESKVVKIIMHRP